MKEKAKKQVRGWKAKNWRWGFCHEESQAWWWVPRSSAVQCCLVATGDSCFAELSGGRNVILQPCRMCLLRRETKYSNAKKKCNSVRILMKERLQREGRREAEEGLVWGRERGRDGRRVDYWSWSPSNEGRIVLAETGQEGRTRSHMALPSLLISSTFTLGLCVGRRVFYKALSALSVEDSLKACVEQEDLSVEIGKTGVMIQDNGVMCIFQNIFFIKTMSKSLTMLVFSQS